MYQNQIILYLLILFEFFYIPTKVFPPLFWIPLPLLTLCPFTLPLFLFRYKQASQGYQSAKVYQVTARLNTSSSFKPGWDNLVGKIGPKSRHQSQRVPALTVRNLRSRPFYTTVTYTVKPKVSFTQVSWLWVQSLRAPVNPCYLVLCLFCEFSCGVLDLWQQNNKIA